MGKGEEGDEGRRKVRGCERMQGEQDGREMEYRRGKGKEREGRWMKEGKEGSEVIER